MNSYFTRFLGHLLLTLLLAFNLVACDSNQAKPIDLGARQPANEIRQHPANTEKLSIGIGSIITPKEGYVYYRRLLAYLEKKLDIHLEAVDAGNYAAMNELLAEQTVAAAFVCGGPYIDAHRDIGVELLVAPVVGGKMTYHSYLITQADQPLTSYAELRDKSFAFTDPGSNSGYLVPVFELKKLGEQPAAFFSKTSFTYGHDRSIRAVAAKLVDAAAVDSLIYDYLAHTDPEMIAKTRIVTTSEPFGIPPLVCGPGLSEPMKARLQEVLLQAHLDPEGAEILKGMHIDRFAVISDSAYDSIRRMRDPVDSQNEN